MSEILFRPAVTSDLPKILKLYDLKESSRKYQQIKNWIENRGDSDPEIFHIAEVDSQIIGGVAIRFPIPNEAWLSHKLIQPDIHNKGIGTSMALYEEDFAKKNNAKHIRLATRVDNYPIHWMIGEKLGYHQVSRWLRLKRLKALKNPTLDSSYFQLLDSPKVLMEVELSNAQSFIENHIDYFISNKIVPFANDLTMYTKLDFTYPDFHTLYKAAILEENNQLKAVLIYTIKKETRDLIITQIYSNRRDYSYYLLYQVLKHTRDNGYFFSLLSYTPPYSIKPLIKKWTRAPKSHYQSDWLILGKELK